MGISSAMNAGVMGLNVNSSKLSTISDNIANSETKGYKRTSMEFSSLVLTERPTSYDAGGVRASTVRDIDDQGALLSTRNNLDLAISGKGFLPVTDVSAIQRGETDLPAMLIRTGSFRPDENGVLRTNSGYALMGYKAEDGNFRTDVARESAANLVPVNVTDVALAAEPTRTINLGANLDARYTGWRANGIPEPEQTEDGLPPFAFSLTAEYFDILGGGEDKTFLFIPSETLENQWTLEVRDQGKETPVGVFDLNFSQETKTPGKDGYPADQPKLQAGYLRGVTPRPIDTTGNAVRYDQLNFVDKALILTGSPTDGAGTTVTSADQALLDAMPALATSPDPTVPYPASLIPGSVAPGGEDAYATANGATLPDTATISPLLNTSDQPLYHAGGTTLSANSADGPQVFVITDADGNRWFTTQSAFTQVDPTTVPQPKGQGTWNAETGRLVLTSEDLLEREVVIGKLGEAGPLSQFKAASEQLNVTKDGSPVSDVIGIEISEAGVMDAIFDSGFRKSIYKIPIGAVQNPNGLNALDGQVYTLSRESGSIYFYDAGAGPTGRLVSNALEESTTDIAEELTSLIKTQRAYSSNAKIIQTVDEMLQETTNLKR